MCVSKEEMNRAEGERVGEIGKGRRKREKPIINSVYHTSQVYTMYNIHCSNTLPTKQGISYQQCLHFSTETINIHLTLTQLPPITWQWKGPSTNCAPQVMLLIYCPLCRSQLALYFENYTRTCGQQLKNVTHCN